jgi:hypothetical protein
VTQYVVGFRTQSVSAVSLETKLFLSVCLNCVLFDLGIFYMSVSENIPLF